MEKKESQIGKLSRIRPTVNFANKMTTFPGQTWGPRKIPDCQLLYVISGQASLILGPQEYKLHTGDCVFYGADSPHMIISSEADPCTFTSIHFSWDKESPTPVHPYEGLVDVAKDQLAEQPREYRIEMEGYGEVVFPHFISLPTLESQFLQIVREYRFEEQGYSMVLRGLMIQLLVAIIRHQMLGQYSSEARRKISPALEAIRKQPNLHWKTAELAQLCGYHPTYFASLFNEATGYSPKHYLILERIRKAKSLLLEIDTIEEVAGQLGYTSSHYFCRNFKMVTGLTPTEFKKLSIEL